MDEVQKQILDEQVWEAMICRPEKSCRATCPGPKDGEVCYYDAEIEGDAEVLRITTEAQRNVTELGYWRDVATGLSALVDKLRAERSTERSTAMAEIKGLRADLENGRRSAFQENTSLRTHLMQTRVKLNTEVDKLCAQRDTALALAALVTPELAELLERLADEIPVLSRPMKWAGRSHPAGSEAVDEARALAVHIKEVLDEHA